MCESRLRISSNQITRLLDVSYRTALPLCHRIRSVLPEDFAAWPKGTVAIGDTCVSEKFRDALVKHVCSEPDGCAEPTA